VADPISPAMEDYLKAIHQIAETATGTASTQALADRLHVSTASVTGMIKRLDSLDLVRHEPYRGVVLTPRGSAVALEVLRHHRLLELYLVEQLGMPWEEVHAEAERLEHHISEALEDRIAAKLGQPQRDPHGDPIPARDGSMVQESTVPLAAAEAGCRARIVRVGDRSAELLQYLAERGLRPGAEVAVERVDLLAGVMVVRTGTAEQALALSVAAQIQVESATAGAAASDARLAR
jgi:DtxR family transcriptional regulator, Mn-dependent transcriptional regulator